MLRQWEIWLPTESFTRTAGRHGISSETAYRYMLSKRTTIAIGGNLDSSLDIRGLLVLSSPGV